MNRIDHISISEIVDEWVKDTGTDQEALDRTQITRNAVDGTQWLTYADNLVQKFVLLNTKSGKVELPSDFCTLVQVAYRKVPKKKDACRTTTKHVSQWIQHDYDSGVDFEISVKCNKCGSKECKCANGIVEIDIDPIDRMHRLEYSGKMARMDSFGHGEGGTEGAEDDNFRLMRYAGSDLHAVNLMTPQCYNLNAMECEHRFSINKPYIQTDIRDDGTEILLAYLGMPTDGMGDPMVPNVADAIDAIKFHLSYKYFYKKHHQTLDPKYKNAYKEAECDRERSISLARAALSNLGYHELHAVLSSTFYGRHSSVGDKYDVYGNEKESHENKWLN